MNLCLKPLKCHLAKKEVEYIGFRAGIIADLAKVKAVREFPLLNNVRQVRSLLGLASY